MPISLDSGVNINDYSPEWIAQVLDTNSSPRVQNIEAKTISADDSTKNYAYYVISIPPATTFAPHQNVFDKKYYRRFDRRSVPMHDYEIRDLLRRGNFPELVVRFKLDGTKSPPSTPMTDGHFAIVVELENLSSEPALYSIFEFYFVLSLAKRSYH
jgi:hypothetical protein